MRASRVLVFVFSALLTAAHARADDFCKHYEGDPSGVDGLVMTYVPDEHPKLDDTRASYVEIDGKKVWRIDLKGYLWLPDPPRKAHGHPVLVYNHGHSSTEPPCTVVNFFRKAGFLVFAPLRRGQGESTGTNIETYSKACDDCDEQEVYDARENAYLQMQSEDIVDAVAWIAKNDYADPKRIAIMGHSYGGMAVLYANALFPKLKAGEHRAIIDISGGELTWDRNRIIRVTLPLAVTQGRYPILFLQPANAVSLGPMTHLMKVARKDDRGHLYPPIDISNAAKKDGDDVHTRFIKARDQVFGRNNDTPGWGADALEFLARLEIK